MENRRVGSKENAIYARGGRPLERAGIKEKEGKMFSGEGRRKGTYVRTVYVLRRNHVIFKNTLY